MELESVSFDIPPAFAVDVLGNSACLSDKNLENKPPESSPGTCLKNSICK